MEMEKRIPRYYKMTLFEVGSAFSLYEKRKLQKGEYHAEKKRKIPIYKLEQKEVEINSDKIEKTTFYRGSQLNAGTMNACNSFAKDNFFYDDEEELLFYMSTFIYAERKGDTYFDLVTGIEIPEYAIECVEKVTTIAEYRKLKSNVQAIVPYTELYQSQFMHILKSNKNRIDVVGQTERTIPGELCDNPTFAQLIDYKKEIVDSGLSDKIEFYIKKIGQKRK